MMDFLYDLDRFAADRPAKKIAVLFHTSMILESTDNLNKLFANRKKNISFYIPENCVCELKLLQNHSSYSKYREKSGLLLKNCSTAKAWSLRNMCTFKDKFLQSYHCDVALFVFFEPAAAASFSAQMGKHPDVFILSYDPFDTNRVFNTPTAAGQRISRRCIPLKNTPSDEAFRPEDRLEIRNKHRQKVGEIVMADLKRFHGGGEAVLFTIPSMPGKVLKIYKYSPSEIMVNKLRLLITFAPWLSGCVLPSELLYRNGKCVGYVMEQLQGSDLGCRLSDFDTQKRKDLIRDMSVILLELRIVQFVVTDISTGNFYIGKDGKLRIIDCDSMQIYYFPGGGVTEPYAHPDVTEDYFYCKLRTSDHINFSYAVLLFEILMGWKNPLIQKGLGDADPAWRKNRFPYANCNGQGVAATGVQPNEAKLGVWCSQPQAVREGFAAVFNFKTTLDIGEWMKILGIC